MKKHCNRFAPALGALLAINIWGAPALAEPPNPEPASTTVADAAWVESIMNLLELINSLLGGDQERIRSEATLSGKMAVVADQYAAHGVPNGLSTFERLQLISAVDTLYTLLAVPPPGSPIARPDAFLQVLKLIWTDLGLPQDLLG